MTLCQLLIDQIRADGPLRLDDYMAAALLHPTKGYYTTRTPFGAKGDFITAPEISQMFGELIGLSLAQHWLDAGSPSPFTLAELGPGRGTLMADILRATKAVPGFHAAAEVHLVEASEILRDVQRDTLAGRVVIWHDSAQHLPDQTLYLVANEFFDALPIRQFERSGSGWRERQIGLTAGKLSLGLGPQMPQPALNNRLDDTADGDLIETSPSLAPMLAPITARIAQHGGVALIIDYGDWRSLGDTFQALQNHKPVDPLAEPGRADLTAHVDFEAISQAAAPCRFSKVTPQGVFLERLGITQRAQKLADGMSQDALERHISAHRRLTHPDEMGTLFKAIALFKEGATPLPGLDA